MRLDDLSKATLDFIAQAIRADLDQGGVDDDVYLQAANFLHYLYVTKEPPPPGKVATTDDVMRRLQLIEDQMDDLRGQAFDWGLDNTEPTMNLQTIHEEYEAINDKFTEIYEYIEETFARREKALDDILAALSAARSTR